MTTFIELLESGRQEANEFAGEALGQALQALVERAQSEGGLEVEALWRLHRQEARRLDLATGLRPVGGWRALSALAVGTGLLRAEEDKFLPGGTEPGAWCDDEMLVRQRLVESMTRWLIPPATAAGLFLAMDIHPLWGLRLARRLHLDSPVIDGPIEGWRDQALLPDEDLSELRKGVFAALSVVIGGLCHLDGRHRYSQALFTAFVGEALAYGCEQIEESGQGLEVILETEARGQARSREFAAQELIERVLVPAGVMRCYDDDTCAVDGDALAAVQVGHLGRDAQQTWLRCFLADAGASMVA